MKPFVRLLVLAASLRAVSAGADVVPSTCPATWTTTTPAGPSARWIPVMGYDPVHRRSLLFGGEENGGATLGDAWAWDGFAWSRLTGSAPAPRKAAAMSYDTARGLFVMFGGSDTSLTVGNHFFLETWETPDGVTWTRHDVAGPPGRVFPAMAYDARRSRTVLFGGDEDHTLLGDTWEWDGTSWTRVATGGPSPRFGASMAFDPDRGRTLLFGGGLASGSSNEVWAWDGASWSRLDLPDPLPSAREGATFLWDPEHHAVVLTGGNGDPGSALETVWELGASGWSSREATPGGARIGAGAAYDAARRRLVLFGGASGQDPTGDTQERRATVDSVVTIPIVLDVISGAAHFTTELSLANRGTSQIDFFARYTASLGTANESGAVGSLIPAGQQVVIPDVLAYLRGLGVQIPTGGQHGGTLTVEFECVEGASLVAATARTTTPVASPAGAAGLAYGGEAGGNTAALLVPGLRANAADRSNVAVYNTSAVSFDDVTLRVTAISGAGDGARFVLDDGAQLPALGWQQYSFGSSGFANGWVLVERIGGAGTFGAYGVVNDNATNDGSFVPALPAGDAATHRVVPVIVETPAFLSELVLTNTGSAATDVTLDFRESLAGASASPLTMHLAAGEQRLVPDAVDFLRRGGAGLPPKGSASFAGAVFVTSSAPGVFAGARTASQSPAGGQFGLFTPALADAQLASTEAVVYGLEANATNRSNAAIVNAGSGTNTFTVLPVRADGGSPVSDPLSLTLGPGAWTQLGGVLPPGAQGWVLIRRSSGTSPWLAYGVVNDGGQPNQRTGDGAYVPMVVP